MASLLVRVPGSDLPEQRYALEKEETVLGRSPDCDVVIPSIFAARQHARITRAGGRFYVEDLDTLSGTWVNGPGVGSQIRGPRLLEDGDEIRLGSAVVQFRE